MDIPALSIAMSMDKVNTEWGVAMMEKSLDMADTVSEDLTKMMESSVTPNLGQSIDVRL
ncbi:MAG: YjfB family protein [Lachnospiraceae bacterium]|nr:YjfB family protein [Lachnospiraceae bacterium]